MEFKDYYDTLGVKPDASQDEIRRAYRRLARKYHPDVSSEADAETRFKDINEAYEALGDADKRAAYDQARAQPQAGGDWQPPPGRDGGFDFNAAGAQAAGGSGYSEFFDSLFGGLGGMGGAQFSGRGADQRAAIRIDLETAFAGGTRSLQLQEPVRGPDGSVQMRTRTLNVKIPPGVTDGQHIRLRGQGGAGMGGGERGDILLEVEIVPHPRFTLEGRDVHLNLPVAPWEAALGARVEVPTLAGSVDVKIPPGSQSGKKLRLAGRGLPGKTKGDEYVTLRIVTPPADSEAARAAYRQLADAVAFNPREA